MYPGSSFRISAATSVSVICLIVALSTAMPQKSFGAEPEALTFVGFDASAMSVEAQDGMEEILAGRLFHNGMPVEAARTLRQMRPPSQQDLGYDPTSSEGRYYSGDQLPSPASRGEEGPLGLSFFTRNDVELRNANCFLCHAGVVHGQVVAGLGNNRTIPRQPPRGLAKTLMMASVSAKLTSAATRTEFLQLMNGAMAGTLQYPETTVRGDHFGAFEVWSLGARLADPERTGLQIGSERTELVKLVESTKLPPINPMPWWVMKYKKRNYWYADAGPHSASSFAVNFTVAHTGVNENHAAQVASTAKALAFARETVSPVFPAALNAELVQQGADLFHGRTRPASRQGFRACKNCHGSYTRKESKTDLSIPGSWRVSYNFSDKLRNVKTDSSYNDVLQKFRPISRHINRLNTYYEEQGTPEFKAQSNVPHKAGYVAPPLVGVWATAPYFHNGSVPTVSAVLNSKERPEIWTWNFGDPRAYDLDRVGLDYRTVTHEEYQISASSAADSDDRSKTAIDHKAIYNTSGYGRANTGHTFGDSLSIDERQAVIEFLKSLSGPDM